MPELSEHKFHSRILTVFRTFIQHFICERIKICIGFLLYTVKIIKKLLIRQDNRSRIFRIVKTFFMKRRFIIYTGIDKPFIG